MCATSNASRELQNRAYRQDPASLEPGVPGMAATFGDRLLRPGASSTAWTPLTVARIRCVPGTGRAATIAVWFRRPPASHWLCDPGLPARAVIEVPDSITGHSGRTARDGRRRVAVPGLRPGLHRGVRELGGAPLERENLGIADHAVADLDRPADGLVAVPGTGPVHHSTQVRDQRLTDLPGGGVPQVGRAVVDCVIVHCLACREHWFGERGGPRPFKAHAL